MKKTWAALFFLSPILELKLSFVLEYFPCMGPKLGMKKFFNRNFGWWHGMLYKPIKSGNKFPTEQECCRPHKTLRHSKILTILRYISLIVFCGTFSFNKIQQMYSIYSRCQ